MYDHQRPLRSKEKFYNTIVRPTILYRSECWAVKKHYIQKVCVAKIRISRKIYDVIRKDRKRNSFIHERPSIASITDR